MKSTFFIISVLICFALSLNGAVAQDEPQRQDLKINLADKADLDLVALIQVLATEKKLKISANSNQFPGSRNTKIVFFGDVAVESDALLDVVQSILRSNGFAIVKSEIKGILQVVPLEDVRPFAQLVPDNNVEGIAEGTYVTGVFPLTYAKESDVQSYIRQFMYTASDGQVTSNITTIPNRNTLVITETVQRLQRIKLLIEKLDVPADKLLREFYQAKNVQAEELRQQLTEILDLSPATTGENQQAQIVGKIRVNAILRTNQLLLTGTQQQIEDAEALLKQLDVANQLKIQTFQFANVSAKQIDQLVRSSLKGIDEDRLERIYQSDINEQTNQLVATTRPEIHARIEALKKQLDVPDSQQRRQSPMKFYTLKNVKAIEILDTLQAIERRIDSSQTRAPNRNRLNGITTVGGIPNNANDFDQPLFQQPPFGPGSNLGLNDPFRQNSGGLNQNDVFDRSVVSDFAQFATAFDTAEKLIPGEAKITVDENTNTLIVVAEPSIQQLYADLIERLDVRRPQVLIEVTLVTITGSEDLDLGVDIAVGDRQGSRQTFAFSQGVEISNFDQASAALALIPGLGFNGTLIDAATADVVVKALSRHRRARVVTAPRILVNDNATGLLSSVSEQPFDSTNVGNATTTTSFGGFAQAGTIISMSPQISEDDYLNLDFDVQVNVFTEESVGIPPRNTDQVTSTVSIPDGHTVIVGGLSRRRSANEHVGIPLVERIPIFRHLTSSQTNDEEFQRFFVFIKPVILRDDKFQDLRYISEKEKSAACIPSDLPKSQPIIIR
ncbi:MAG: secretin N-terminal domain-containing protein [Planctomycetota bacterium]